MSDSAQSGEPGNTLLTHTNQFSYIFQTYIGEHMYMHQPLPPLSLFLSHTNTKLLYQQALETAELIQFIK